MAEYCLTAEEVLYLAALSGAETFYGVPDVLSELSDQELKLKVMEIEESLGKKGYLEEDFDGNKNVAAKLVRFIEGCGNCEKFLCFEKERVGETQQSFIYFWKERAAYKMACNEGQYTFSEIGNAQIRKEIICAMPIRETKEVLADVFAISQKRLEKAGILIRRGDVEKGEELLKEAGAAEWMSHLIADGIRTKADFYALLFMDMGNEDAASYSIKCLQGERLILMEHEMIEDEDYVRFSAVEDVELKRRMAAVFKKIGCGEEAEWFL